MQLSLYAWLMAGSLLGPFLLSFDKKVAYYKKWPLLIVGILVNAILFVTWDIWFTSTGVWGFSKLYTWPVRIAGMPIEEYSFFFVIPYASVFIYVCLKAYFKLDFLRPYTNYITYFFMALTLLLGLVYYQNTYTVVNALIAFLVLAWVNFSGEKEWMHWFWAAYFVHLIPFFIVNGVLTGALTPEPVVWYNNQEIIGLRIVTIPFEDCFYALSCLLIPISVMEWLSTRLKN